MTFSLIPDAAELGTAVDVHAGFPNAAADTRGDALSLDRLLISSPHSTYFFRVRGHHWRTLGIFDGDIAVVDRTLQPRRGDTIVTWDSTDEFLLERWPQTKASESWGVIIATVHPLRHRQGV